MKALTNTVARKQKSAACISTFVPVSSTRGIQSAILCKASQDLLCDHFEESDSNEVEFKRTSVLDTCKSISVSHTTSAAFRSGVSERVVPLFASAMLQDAKLITEEDMNLNVRKNKIRMEKKKQGR